MTGSTPACSMCVRTPVGSNTTISCSAKRSEEADRIMGSGAGISSGGGGICSEENRGFIGEEN